MGIMNRILRIWKADIHGFMDRLEDQDLLLRQYLREMEQCLQQKEQRINHLAERSRVVQIDLSARENEIEKLENDLKLALHKKNDNIATLLIRKQMVEQEHCAHLQRQQASFLEEQKQLVDLLNEQQLRYETLKVKASTFLQRNEKRTAYGIEEPIHKRVGGSTVNEDEIELELIRRKERWRNNGGTA